MIRSASEILLIGMLLVVPSRAMAQFDLAEPAADSREETDTTARDDSSERTNRRQVPRRTTNPSAVLAQERPADGTDHPAIPAAKPGQESPIVPDTMSVALIEADMEQSLFFSASVPRTQAIAADATLRDVSVIGSTLRAVGDRGVVCQSDDGGATWTTRFVPFDCSLTSVCFLTDRIGWIAGVRMTSDRASGRAVLLHTRDGGATWKDLEKESGSIPGQIGATSSLPGILGIQYFGLDDAIAITLPDPERQNASLLRSTDGGITWTPIESDQDAAPWTQMAFASPDEGILAGMRQCYAAVVSSQAVVINTPQQTLRNMTGASLDSNGRGWLGGDGCVLLRTDNGGISWVTPEGEFPDGLADILDIVSVCHRERTVYACGNPAATLLTSEDDGATWSIRPLPAHGMIHRIRCFGDQSLIAVGSFGQILISPDAGQTWEAVRSSGFHSGLINVVTESGRASIQMLASVTSDRGVRSSVIQPSASLTATTSAFESMRESWRERLSLAGLGTSDCARDWMFPRTQPEHSRSRQQLIAEWDRQTDGRLRELLPLRLARDLRNWRPLVVAVEPADESDATAQLFRDALEAAIRMAESVENEKLALVGLDPWSVERILMRTGSDLQTPLFYDDATVLRQLGTTTGLLCDAVESVRTGPAPFSQARRTRSSWDLSFDRNNNPAVNHAFQGLEPRLTSDVQRPLIRRSREDVEQLEQTARTAQSEAAALDSHMKLMNVEEAFVAELHQIGAQLPDTLALRQLRDLATVCLERDNIEGYLSAQQELLRRFPDSEEARRAAETLLLLYSSAETRHYRLRDQTVPAPAPELPGPIPSGRIPNGSPLQPVQTMSPQVEPVNASSFSSAATPARSAVHEKWDRQLQIAWQLLNRHPGSGGSSGSNLPPSAILRQAVTMRLFQKVGESTTLFSELANRRDDIGVWAASELQVLQGVSPNLVPVFNLPRRSDRPYLDGQLTDAMWEQAQEIRLTLPHVSGHEKADSSSRSDISPENPASLVMLAWDQQFLYFAARLDFPGGEATSIRTVAERSHDAAHGTKDRVELVIDTDRDYLTGFRMTVDESGQTSDSAWWLERWNPKWHVAVDRDSDAWRIEAAIPLNELTSSPVQPGQLWSVRFKRIIPGRLEQELPPSGARISMNGAGLIRFTRPGIGTRK